LVHEAYLRLVGAGDQQWNSRGHFFAAAALAMRRILVEGARHRRTHKRGGNLARQDLGGISLASPEPQEDLLALDEALTRLAATDQTAANVVQLRYFTGLTLPDTAQALGISARTAGRLWAFARAWLRREIEDGGNPHGKA
jgi:RNA polymerase sigma factor (TIGR02999 family)